MRFKIMVALLLLVTAVVSAISFTMANLFHADKSKYISDVSALVAHHGAEEATVILNGYRGRLESYGRVAVDPTLDTQAKSAILRKLVGDLPDLILLAIHQNGERVGALYDDARLADAGVDKALIEEFLEAHPIDVDPLLNGKTLVENATVSAALPVLRMAVVSSTGGPEGTTVVEAIIGLSDLMNIAARSKVFDVSLVDASGVVLSDRRAEAVAGRERRENLPEVSEHTLAEARTFDVKGTPMIAGFSRARLGGVMAVAQVPKSVAFFASRELLGQLGTMSLALLLVTALVGMFWARTLTRPIARLVQATSEIAKGRFDVTVEATSKDEIGTLSESFNGMASELHTRERALKEAQGQLIHSEKMAAFGQLGAGFAHEIKNPLAGILGLIQVYHRQTDAGTPIHEGLAMMEKETKRCKAIIDNLLKFSRQEKMLQEPTDIAVVIQDAASILRHQMGIHQVELAVQCDEDLPAVMGNGNQLQQVLMNLMLNAQQALKGVEHARVEVSAQRDGADHVAIHVRDNGMGIPKDIQQRIFEPFFTTKPAGEGTGLGLSVSFGIIREHGGAILLESEPGKGTCFTLRLPVRAADVAPSAEALPRAA